MKYFKLKFLLLFFALAAAIPPAGAQETLLVCDGTSTSGYLPIAYAGAYGDSYPIHQMIYPAELLADLEGCQITGLTFYTQQEIMCNQGTFNVLIGETTETSFSSASAITGLTTVVTNRAPQTGGTEFVVNFDNEYEYQGGNLVIEFYLNAKLYPYYASLYFYGQTQTTNTGFAYGTTRSFLPKVTISYEPSILAEYKAKIEPDAIDFGKTAPNVPITKDITVTNKGSNPITPVVTGLTAPFSTTYTPTAIAYRETATIPIVYNPTTTGEFDCMFEVGDANGNIDPVEVIVSGTCANEITVANGNSSDDHLPVYGLWFDADYQINQMLYPQNMLTSLVGKNIKSMTFYAPSGLKFNGKNNTSTVTFKLANMAASTPLFVSEPYHKDADFTAETTITMPSEAEAGAITEWVITFDEPFNYTGGDLLLEVNTTKGNYGGTSFSGVTTSGYQSYYQYNSNAYNIGFLPKVTFSVEDSGETPVVTVDAPVFDPEDGTTFEENLTVTLTCATAGAKIYYGYNDQVQGIEYTAPFEIDETTTVYAKAVLGTVESEVVSATYTKEAAPQPSDCPAVIEFGDNGADATQAFADVAALKAYITSGDDFVADMTCDRVYPGVTGIKFSASKNNGYLTIDLANLTSGSWVTSKIIVNAKKYGSEDAAISVNGSDAVSLTENYADYEFPVTSTDPLESITINATKRLYVKSITIMHDCGGATPEPLQVKTPIFDPEQGEYTEAQNVTITCATEDAVIHYTVDGTDPTAESAVYNEAIAVGETTTIKAIAMKEGMTDSEIATATYTINIPSGDGKIYVKLTNPELTPGKKYIFVYEGEQAMAMGAFNSGNTKCNPVNVTINNNEVNIAGKDDIIEFTAGEGPAVYGSDIKQYTLVLPSGQYLAYKSSTDFKLMTSTDTEAYWRIKTHDGGYTVYNASSTGRSIQKNTSTNMFGPYADGQDLVAIYVEKKDEPIVPELTVALDPAEKTYTVGNEAKIMVNVENGNEDTMVSYKINGGEDQDYNAETGIVLPNDKAKEYTVTVYATDGEREATATGTYSFTAAPAFDITLTPNKEGNYTVGDEAVVNVTVDNVIGEDYLVTYTIGDSEEQIEYNAETGIVLPNDKAGDVTVKVYVTDGYEHAGDEFVSATYHFNAAPAIVVTLDPASGNYYIGEEVKVTVTAENTIGDYVVTYKIGDGEELDYEDGIIIPSDQEGTVNLTVSVIDDYHENVATAEGAYTFAPRPVVAMPTLSLVGGTYGEAQQLTITAENGATILYSTDGSEPTTEYTSAIALGEGTTTVKAIATLDGYTNSPVATATYIIEIPAELPDVPVMKGYFQIKNNGNNKYANIAGRKTLNFTNDPADKAGTVIWLETNGKGQVQSLRSQAADLQGYANRAMRYVPDIVELVVDKLNAEGAGEILGEHGLDEIMEKFDECFDYHLYVEEADGGYRLYGKTPSMQPVVDFYREHTHQVETKLPKLEQFINDALAKLREKIGGSSVFTDFSLLQIWENMGGTLTQPVDDESTMAFYREVLNNKNYVWDFAYQTAMIYVNNVKNHPRWSEVEDILGEYAQYIDMIEQVRPDFKYYVVQENDKPDFISEGNRDIINNADRTIWTLEERTTFTVNFPDNGANACNMYSNATTLYTDFAYTLPEGVKAYKVTAVDENGNATTEALSGVIPAQTPVMLTSTVAGPQVLTLSTEAGTAVTGNLLVGPDYLINTYNLKTALVQDIFDKIKEKLPTFYENYIAQYEYLADLNSGTVNNKYFWGLKQEDVAKCGTTNEYDQVQCVVRNLEGDKFVYSTEVKTNKAFLVSDEHNAIGFEVRQYDVNHDGRVDVKDITDLIDFMLGLNSPACPKCSDVNKNSRIDVEDVTDLIDYLLENDAIPEPEEPGTGD